MGLERGVGWYPEKTENKNWSQIAAFSSNLDASGFQQLREPID